MAEVEDRPRDLIVTTASETGGRVRLSVRDVGVGVQPDASEKLFEAFHTTKPNGMGIGLAISRSIIESHEGRLWVEPNNGPGATFVFSIPAALDATAGPDARHVRAGAALTMTSPCANRDVATSP
jgi:signal transduction histidine kinase